MAFNISGFIRKKLDDFQDNVFNNAANRLLDSTTIDEQIGSGIRSVGNWTPPGAKMSLGQAVSNVRSDPNKSNLFYAMSNAGNAGSPFNLGGFVNRNITRPVGQAATGVADMSTFGLLPLAKADPTNKRERIANLGGMGIGLVNPMGMMGVLGKTGAVGFNTTTRLLPQATPKLASKILPHVGSELAQTGTLLSAYTAAGKEFNPATDLAFGLGGRTLLGGAGRILGKGAVNYGKMAPADLDDALKAIERHYNNSTDINYAMKQGAKDEKLIRDLAGDYIGKDFAKNSPLEQVRQELLNRIRIEQGRTQIAMGIKGAKQGGKDAEAGLYDTAGQNGKIGNMKFYRGQDVRNVKGGDQFFSADKSVAGDYGKVSQIKPNEMPKKPLVVSSKDDLVDLVGYKGDPLAERLNIPKEQRFDTLAKRYAQSKGHDGIIYQEGSLGAPELHKFRVAQQPPTSTAGFYDTKVGDKVVVDAFGGLKLPVRVKSIVDNKMEVELLTDSSLGKAGDTKRIGADYISSKNIKDVNAWIKAIKTDGKPPKQIEDLRSAESIINRIEGKSRVAQPKVDVKKLKAKQQTTGQISQLQPAGLKQPLVALQSTPAKPVSEAVGSQVSSGGIIPQKSKKYAYNINKEKLGLEGKDAKKLDDVVKKMKPILQERKGKPLTDKEVIREGRKAQMLDEVMGRDEAAKFAAQLQATRNFVRTASKEQGVTPEYLAQLDILSSTAADTGRKLRAFGIDAEDVTIKELVFKDLQKLNIQTKQLVEAAKGVDWDNAQQVTEFYRKFKKAGITEILEEFRYTNMLSSPNTHIINAFSNFLQGAVVAPVEKTLAGGIDVIASKLTGRERQYFASQGVDYTRGFWKALPEATRKFINVTKGDGSLMKPDIDFIPTGTGRAHKLYTTPLRMLEAGDQFFRTMIREGELASYKNLKLTDAQKLDKANEAATYRVFRQQFDPNGKHQGGLLKIWDKWNAGINSLRKLPGGKWMVPFLQTPTNILKQGVEYSPLGIATVPGSKEPIVQLAKTMMGTVVFTSAYALAEAGRTTWDAPINKKERDAFYAAGLQPYSVKIGDEWVSYSKLGPLSYPIAMAAAMKWAQDNGADDSLLSTAGAGVAGFAQFFADQSYMQGIGDVIDAVRGDEFKQGRSLSNVPSQLVPYRAFMGWVARIVDPVYRKTTGGSIPEQVMKSMISQMPFASKTLEPYTDPEGNPSLRSHPLINAFSPLKLSHEQGEHVGQYNQTHADAQQRKKDLKIKKELGIESSEPADVAIVKDRVKNSGESVVHNGIAYYRENGEVKSLKTKRQVKLGELTGIEEIDKRIVKNYKSAVSRRQNEIVKLYQNGFITKEHAQREIERLENVKDSLLGKAGYGEKSKLKVKKTTVPKVKAPSTKLNLKNATSGAKLQDIRIKSSGAKTLQVKKPKKLNLKALRGY